MTSSTPPRVSGSPDQEAHRRWVEEQIADLRGGVEVVDTRVRAASTAATNAGNVASSVAVDQALISERVVGMNPDNRIARPILDGAFWLSVVAGSTYVWNTGTAHSTARNVTWNAAGAFLFQPNGTTEGAEIDITPILATPQSGKLYLEAEYGGSPSLRPEIWVTWYDQYNTPYDVTSVIAPPTLAASKSVINVPKDGGVQVFKYSVRLVRPAGTGVGGAISPKVFEAIGTDGLTISPGGIAVEDSGGNKTIEINPTLPTLAAPTTPTLTTGSASVSVRWNGSLTSGAAPAHLSYVFAEEATSASGPWTRVGQPLNRAGDVLTRPPVGSTRWYRFTAMDTSNRPSPAGASASILVAGVSIPDVAADIVDAITDAQDAADAAAAAAAAAQAEADVALASSPNLIRNPPVAGSGWTVVNGGLERTNGSGGVLPFTEVDVIPGRVYRASVNWEATAPTNTFLAGITRYTNGVWGPDGNGLWIGPVYGTEQGTRTRDYTAEAGVTKLRLSGWSNSVAANSKVRINSWSIQDVTEIVGVLQAATNAQTTASNAAAAALTAQTTADGKNRIYLRSTTPVVAATELKLGDLWYVLQTDTATITDVRSWNGTAWVPYRLVADSVIVPSSIGTISLGDGAITGPKVATRTLTADNIAVGGLDVDVLSPNIGAHIDILINPAISDLQSGLEQQTRVFRFDNEGIKVGDPATDQELRLNPGRIEMVQAGNVSTYWEAQSFYVERMIVDAANIGSHRFEGYANGRTVIRPLRGV